ncbi:ADP-ribosylglycohydrolase family protein [Agrobacterium pusense]|nr:ADP-ribosylglycohydrolase family protein [Agrobacterium pusense]MBW9068288.1 ADP-ribosylglycohydrolase family protein [Agrobacterium pusense]MBW9081766.1 ADP-ribosylglycohydrolase family protein [Agrobacterium pusense]MBW9122908.1 ADP-ribosylglycohydrolase family protein [Agrobacterium pusense]MBW9136876.1 ADP-ribosylglycohydrolase family protein [Agrobacterium pusense]
MAARPIDVKQNDVRFRGVVLGAAFGDAMGWPNEGRAQNTSTSPKASLRFVEWVKRSGGRFQPHEEHIPAGTYSDDTQLIIAGGRARLHYSQWWRYFAQVELPLWTLYERGGGGASLRAARLWLKGSPPWNSSLADRSRYFEAGGNGVAMRVAPHVLVGINDGFDSIGKEIIANGVTTHGHPEALVGSLVYGYALWYALRNTRTLDYGEILRVLLKNQAAWSTWPDIEAYWPDWLTEAKNHGFEEKWSTAISDILVRLEIGLEGLEVGALSFDHETMQKLGCFRKDIGGAGGVAASAAIYLASRHAAGPLEGVLTAAYAKGSDTDTIASMTGALSGAISGVEWMGSLMSDVQDARFLMKFASSLAAGPTNLLDVFAPITPKKVSSLIAEIASGSEQISLPLGFPKNARSVNFVRSKSQNLKSQSWLVDGHGEATIVVKKLSKAKSAKRDGETQQMFEYSPIEQPVGEIAAIAGICLLSADINRSVWFYNELLGLPILSRSQGQVRLDQQLVLRQQDGKQSTGAGTIIYLRHQKIDACIQRLHQAGIGAADTSNGSRKKISCVDPDGRTVEIIPY